MRKRLAACRNEFPKRLWSLIVLVLVVVLVFEFSLVTHRFRSGRPGFELLRSHQSSRTRTTTTTRTIKELRRGDQKPRIADPAFAVQNSDLQRRSVAAEPCPHCPCLARGFAVTISPLQPYRTLRCMEPQILERVTFWKHAMPENFMKKVP